MPAPGKRQGRGKKGQEAGGGRREAILDAALALFSQHGFDATSTARIAIEASVPTGLVFYYFPSKLDLLLSIVRERATVDQFLPAPADLIAGDIYQSTVNLIERIRAHLRAQRAVILIVFMEVGRHSEVRDQARALRAAAADAITRGLTAALSGTDEGTDNDEESRRTRLRATAQMIAPALVLDSILGFEKGAFDTEAVAEVVAAAVAAKGPINPAEARAYSLPGTDGEVAQPNTERRQSPPGS